MWKHTRRTWMPCVHSHLLRALLLFRLPHIRLYHTIVPCSCSCEECGDMAGDEVDMVVGWCNDGTITMLVLLDIPGEDTSSGGVTSSPMLPFSAILMALPLISLGCSCEQKTKMGTEIKVWGSFVGTGRWLRCRRPEAVSVQYAISQIYQYRKNLIFTFIIVYFCREMKTMFEKIIDSQAM